MNIIVFKFESSEYEELYFETNLCIQHVSISLKPFQREQNYFYSGRFSLVKIAVEFDVVSVWALKNQY